VVESLQRVSLEIIDIAGVPFEDNVWNNYARSQQADAFVVVYSLIDTQTLEHTKDILRKIREIKYDDEDDDDDGDRGNTTRAAVVLAANKLDLITESFVTPSAEYFGAAADLLIFPTSAAHGTNINTMFTELVKICVHNHRQGKSVRNQREKNKNKKSRRSEGGNFQDSEEEGSDRSFRIVVIGANGVGKTSVCKNYMQVQDAPAEPMLHEDVVYKKQALMML
jgi:GTPase SAR1 family protein